MVRCQSYWYSMSDIVDKTKIKFLVHAKLFNISSVFNQQKKKRETKTVADLMITITSVILNGMLHLV